MFLDDYNELNSLCDDVINKKITCEELLEEEEHVVSSTETTPVKLSLPKKGKGSSSARVLKVSKQLKEAEILSQARSIQSARKRANELFGRSSKARIEETYSSDSEDEARVV